MPYFTLHRSYVLRTTKGHSIGFEKDVPTWVVPVCIKDAVAIGAIPQEPVDVIDDAAPLVDYTVDEREAKLYAAYATMLGRAERGDFTANGVPHAKRLWEMCGFEVTSNERDDTWRTYQQKVAENVSKTE